MWIVFTEILINGGTQHTVTFFCGPTNKSGATHMLGARHRSRGGWMWLGSSVPTAYLLLIDVEHEKACSSFLRDGTRGAHGPCWLTTCWTSPIIPCVDSAWSDGWKIEWAAANFHPIEALRRPIARPKSKLFYLTQYLRYLKNYLYRRPISIVRRDIT